MERKYWLGNNVERAGVTKLVTAILARNEAAPDRYLRRVLARCAEFSDTVLVLDDNSTDATPDIAREMGCVVQERVGAPAWGAEAPARCELWEAAAELAGDGWLIVCDADMILVGDPRPLTLSWEAAAFAWPLADLWDSEDTFRVDGPWGLGCATPRPWMFRPSALQIPATWPENCAIHAGHAPSNFGQAGPTFTAPPDMYWLHYSYLRPNHRMQKHEQ